MGDNVNVIDHFLDVFGRYIDSGFGLISGDVGFLTTFVVGIDATLAALAWAMGEDEVLQAFAKKILMVGFFALLLNRWHDLTAIVFTSFAAIGLKASGSTLSYADFLQPGHLAMAGLRGANVLLAQIGRMSGFPDVFSNFPEILVMGISWIVTLLAFFILAILLFLAVIEFKLTTLKGFILVPFALWRGTSFIAEPVLGQVVTSGVRILVFAVVTGIGTQLFGQILPSNDAQEIGLQDALTILLASMTVGGLALYSPRIASGIVSGAPQLGLGAAAAPAAAVAGTVVLGAAGLGAAARVGVGAVASAASMAGGARAAYSMGSMGSGGGLSGVAGGLGGVGRAGAGAATSGLRAAGRRAATALRERFVDGERSVWSATGGEPVGQGGPPPPAPRDQAPGWARQLRGEGARRAAGQAAREGEGTGAGLKPDLDGDER